MDDARSITVVMTVTDPTGWHDVLAEVRSLEHSGSPPDQLVVVVDHDDELLERVADHLGRRSRGFAIEVIANVGPPGPAGCRRSVEGWAVGEVVIHLDERRRERNPQGVALVHG